MNRTGSLRSRLTLTFAGLMGLTVLSIAVGARLHITETVWEPVDAALREEAEDLSMIKETSGVDVLKTATALVAGERDFGGHKKFVRVTAADGDVVAQSGTLPAEGEALSAAEHPVAMTVGEGNTRYRVVSHIGASGDRAEVGVSVVHQIRMLHRADGAIAATAGGLILALSAVAWLITTRATAELGWVAAELETLEASTLDRRLAPRDTAEVASLVAVLNRLLGRLERAVDHLRRFTADAAHELRTPIAGLRARLEVAIAQTGSPDASRNGLLDALEQTERLGRLAEDLLTLSVMEGGGVPQETVRLDTIAREVAEFLEPVAEEQGRQFQCRAEPGIAVSGSPGLLKRLMLNLVDNAFRHTPATAPVKMSVAAVDGRATLEVRDSGPGIAPGDLPFVFERFYRSRTATAGSGLGLALCHEIARRHRGDIQLKSTPESGTTVTVTLPRVKAEFSSS